MKIFTIIIVCLLVAILLPLVEIDMLNLLSNEMHLGWKIPYTFKTWVVFGFFTAVLGR